jgi:hypothetical protein
MLESHNEQQPNSSNSNPSRSHRLLTVPELAHELNIPETAVLAAKGLGAPFPFDRSRPEWISDFIRREHASCRVVEPPFSPGYTSALAEGRAPSKQDLFDSIDKLAASPRERITLSAEASLAFRLFGLFAGATGEEVANAFINAGQLLYDLGTGDAEACSWWSRRPAEQRPAWARETGSASSSEFHALLRELKEHAAPDIRAAVTCERHVQLAA